MAAKISGAILLALVFLSVTYFPFPSRRVENTDSRFQLIGEVLQLDGVPFTGIQTEQYFNGELYKELHYENGLLEGKSFEYSFGKRLRAIWNYEHGVKHGVQQTWHAEGPKKSVEHFKHGILDGEFTEWHLNGSVFRQITFVDGIETARKILYANSNIYSNYIKANNRSYGIDGGALCMEVKREGTR